MARQPIKREKVWTRRVGYDWSPADINRNNKQLTAGLRFNEPIPLHIHNTVALGYVQNSLSSQFLPPDAAAWKAERAVECNARLDVAPMLMLQPVVQVLRKCRRRVAARRSVRVQDEGRVLATPAKLRFSPA